MGTVFHEVGLYDLLLSWVQERQSQRPLTLLRCPRHTSLFAAPLEWDIDEDIAHEARSHLTPQGCPPGWLFVPLALQNRVIEWAHTLSATGHPGEDRTLSVLTWKYCWPGMTLDIQRAVQSCSVCAATKSSRRLLASKLMLLPVPDRLLSHLAVDFVTDLPTSKRDTCILVVVGL